MACMLSKKCHNSSCSFIVEVRYRQHRNNIWHPLTSPQRTYGTTVEDKFRKLKWMEDTGTWSAAAERGATKSDERHKTGGIR
jgi:hypothetical protein